MHFFSKFFCGFFLLLLTQKAKLKTEVFINEFHILKFVFPIKHKLIWTKITIKLKKIAYSASKQQNTNQENKKKKKNEKLKFIAFKCGFTQIYRHTYILIFVFSDRIIKQ